MAYAWHGFWHLWKQEDMSYAQIFIYAASVAPSVGSRPSETHNSNPNTLLQQFPGHSDIQNLSDYFKAQGSTSM